jgi:hypothetical protein
VEGAADFLVEQDMPGEFVDIEIRAGGDVYVYGNPEEVRKDQIFGGRIYIRD